MNLSTPNQKKREKKHTHTHTKHQITRIFNRIMSKTTPVASPSPPLRSVSRHQSPQSKQNASEISIHRKSAETICDSPTDFQMLATKSTDAYQDDEQFSSANCKETLFFVFSLARISMSEVHAFRRNMP